MDLLAQHNQQMKVFHDIVGCAMDVYNEYNHGLSEYPYQYGLKHLLRLLGYRVEKEYELPLYLFGTKLEEGYRCDIVMVRPEGNIIIECKALAYIDDKQREQLRNYMLLTHCPYGVLINFCKTKHQVFSETYQYLPDKHNVEIYDTKYLGNNYPKTAKPWQEILNKRRQNNDHYYHQINIPDSDQKPPNQ